MFKLIVRLRRSKNVSSVLSPVVKLKVAILINLLQRGAIWSEYGESTLVDSSSVIDTCKRAAANTSRVVKVESKKQEGDKMAAYLLTNQTFLIKLLREIQI